MFYRDSTKGDNQDYLNHCNVPVWLLALRTTELSRMFLVRFHAAMSPSVHLVVLKQYMVTWWWEINATAVCTPLVLREGNVSHLIHVVDGVELQSSLLMNCSWSHFLKKNVLRICISGFYLCSRAKMANNHSVLLSVIAIHILYNFLRFRSLVFTPVHLIHYRLVKMSKSSFSELSLCGTVSVGILPVL